MRHRKGEKVGWIGGWLGGFLWLLLLSILWLVLGRTTDGVLGLVLFTAAVAAVPALAPWRHPGTPYWKLMLPIYVILAASIGLCVWRGSGLGGPELSPWSLFLLTPLLIPFATTGARRWKDGDHSPPKAEDGRAGEH